LGKISSALNIMVGKPEWKRSLGGPSRRWEDTVGMDLREMAWECVD